MNRLAIAAAMAVLSVVPAKADIIDYTQLLGGVTFTGDQDVNTVSTDVETGYNVGGTLGWNLSPQFALEADFFFTASDYDIPSPGEGSLESFSFMANAIWNIDAGSSFKPFIGVGAGGVQLRFTDGVTSGGVPYTGDTDTVFGYQGLAGFAINCDTGIDFIMEYRYQGADDAEGNTTALGVPSPLEFEYSSHNLSAGFRFTL